MCSINIVFILKKRSRNRNNSPSPFISIYTNWVPQIQLGQNFLTKKFIYSITLVPRDFWVENNFIMATQLRAPHRPLLSTARQYVTKGLKGGLPSGLSNHKKRKTLGLPVWTRFYIFRERALKKIYFLAIQAEMDMIVVTVFILTMNQMKFRLDRNQKENWHYDNIPFNLKGIRNIFLWVRYILRRCKILPPKLKKKTQNRSVVQLSERLASLGNHISAQLRTPHWNLSGHHNTIVYWGV